MKISIFDWFSRSCSTAKENYIQLLKYSTLFFLTSFVAGFSIIGFIIVPNITIAYKRALYLIAKNEPVSFKDCLKYSFNDGMWWRSICFLVLMSLLCFTSLIPFIIPGIILAVTLFFAPVSFASEKKGVFEAFNHSSLLVQKIGFAKVLGFAAFVIFAATFTNIVTPLLLLGFPGILVHIALNPIVALMPISAFIDMEEKNVLAN